MKLLSLVTSLVVATSAVQAQNLTNMSSFTDASANLTFKLAIPDTASAPFPLLMSIVAPIGVSWAGFATGGCMLRSPLIVAWANGTAGVAVTTRWATQFHPPTPYLNTTITVFPTSTVNATHWKADFLCSAGCSDWWGGAIDPNNSNATFGYGASSRPVAQPGNLAGPIPFHNLVAKHFDMDLTKAKRGKADWDALVRGAGGGGGGAM